MNKIDATAIVSNVWNGTYQADARFVEALRVLGMTTSTYKRFFAEARRVEVRHPRRVVLIAAGTGR